jgi:hypothetical protein
VRSAILGASCATLAGVGLLVGIATAGADSVPPDPSGNIAYTIPGACSGAPTGAACESSAVQQLNAARGVMGLGAYQLPAGFGSRPGTEQMFILSNEDRLAYGEQPILGLNASINAAAQAGAAADGDPAYPSDLPAGWGWTSNNAIGFPNALFAYYFWMFADGYTGHPGVGNIDCPTPTSAACWGHRHGILAFASSTGDAMGDAAASDSHSRPVFALEIVQAQSALPYVYTWQQALADGAGSGAPPPVTTMPATTVPVTTTAPAPATTAPATTIAKVPARRARKLYRLTIRVVGGGAVRVRPTSGTSKYTAGTSLELTARPKVGWRLERWTGPCTGRHMTCTFRLTRARTVTAAFVKT